MRRYLVQKRVVFWKANFRLNWFETHFPPNTLSKRHGADPRGGMAENPQPSESMCSSLGRSGPLDRHRGVGPWTFRSCRRLVSALFRPRCSCSQRMSSKKSMWKGLVRTSNLDAHVTTHEGGQIYQNIRNACSLTFGCSIGNIWATGKATHKQDITLDTKQSFTPN